MHAFDVLGDPVRRRILELLAEGEQPAGTLGATVQREFGISQPAVSQHLKVLREAQLVREDRHGTRHYFSLNPAAFGELRQYADSMWQDALNAFAAYVSAQTASATKDKRRVRKG